MKIGKKESMLVNNVPLYFIILKYIEDKYMHLNEVQIGLNWINEQMLGNRINGIIKWRVVGDSDGIKAIIFEKVLYSSVCFVCSLVTTF